MTMLPAQSWVRESKGFTVTILTIEQTLAREILNRLMGGSEPLNARAVDLLLGLIEGRYCLARNEAGALIPKGVHA